jgi:hypothetical protein
MLGPLGIVKSLVAASLIPELSGLHLIIRLKKKMPLIFTTIWSTSGKKMFFSSPHTKRSVLQPD